jgi:hypothetical protein
MRSQVHHRRVVVEPEVALHHFHGTRRAVIHVLGGIIHTIYSRSKKHPCTYSCIHTRTHVHLMLVIRTYARLTDLASTVADYLSAPISLVYRACEPHRMARALSNLLSDAGGVILDKIDNSRMTKENFGSVFECGSTEL